MMFKRMKERFSRLLTVLAPLALALAVMTANSTCFYFTHQPDEPVVLRSYKKEG